MLVLLQLQDKVGVALLALANGLVQADNEGNMRPIGAWEHEETRHMLVLDLEVVCLALEAKEPSEKLDFVATTAVTHGTWLRHCGAGELGRVHRMSACTAHTVA